MTRPVTSYTSTNHADTNHTANEAVVRRVFDQIVNRGRFELVDELYDPDVVDHDPFPGAPAGRPGIRHTLSTLRRLYPDVEVTINQLTSHGDKVTLRNTWRGTLARGLRSGPRPARRVELDGIVVFRLRDGRVVERWATLEIGRMFDQLGVEAAEVMAAGVIADEPGVAGSDTSTLRALGELLARSAAP